MKESTKSTISNAVAVILILLGIWTAYGAYLALQEFFTPEAGNSSVSESKEDWITYTNKPRGYAISYPSNQRFLEPAEHARGEQQGQVVVVVEGSGTVYPIVAGVVDTTFIATTTADLLEKTRTISVPELANGENAKELGLTETDYKVSTSTLGGQPAVQIISPSGYFLQTFSKPGTNSKGIAPTISVYGYSGTSNTQEERTVRAVIDTFRVLD